MAKKQHSKGNSNGNGGCGGNGGQNASDPASRNANAEAGRARKRAERKHREAIAASHNDESTVAQKPTIDELEASCTGNPMVIIDGKVGTTVVLHLERRDGEVGRIAVDIINDPRGNPAAEVVASDFGPLPAKEMEGLYLSLRALRIGLPIMPLRPRKYELLREFRRALKWACRRELTAERKKREAAITRPSASPKVQKSHWGNQVPTMKFTSFADLAKLGKNASSRTIQ